VTKEKLNLFEFASGLMTEAGRPSVTRRTSRERYNSMGLTGTICGKEALTEGLEQQFGAALGQRHVSQFIDDEKLYRLKQSRRKRNPPTER
jgi:hypothetical protein